MRLAILIVALACAGLSACNGDDLTTKTPVLFAADAQGAPAARDGVWISDNGCSVDPALDLPAWDDCADAFIVRRGKVAHPDDAVESDPARLKAIRLALAPDFQIAQQGPGDGGSDGYYSYLGVDGIQLDETGRAVALRVWPLKCGPPPPDGTKTPGGKPRYQTLKPYPGVEVEEGGCAARGRAGLIAAATASRADPEGNHGSSDRFRWLREERPGDWVEAQPVEEQAEPSAEPKATGTN